MIPLQAGLGSGTIQSFAQVAAIAGTLVLILLLVAFAGVAYRSLSGDGIEWPGDVDRDADPGRATGDPDPDPGGDDGVRRGGQDDDWKYY
jgi:hypothetical protein